MKHHHVACGIIERNGLVLAAQRSAAMALPLQWEFPGGKIDAGEKPSECLRRELEEELNLQVAVRAALAPATHDYSRLRVTLHPFVCTIEAGELQVREHAAIAWLPPDQLHQLDWADADVPVLAAYCRLLAE